LIVIVRLAAAGLEDELDGRPRSDAELAAIRSVFVAWEASDSAEREKDNDDRCLL